VEQIATVALRLFEERGYEAVTMDDVAGALGVGRRTLFSYYRSKSAIVWDGQRQAADAWVAALEDAPADVGWRDAVADAFAGALEYPGDDLQLMRSRLRIIARHPDLQAHLLTEQEAFAGSLVAFIARREGLEATDLLPVVSARAVLAALATALVWWADSTREEPRDVVREALRQVFAAAPPVRSRPATTGAGGRVSPPAGTGRPRR